MTEIISVSLARRLVAAEAKGQLILTIGKYVDPKDELNQAKQILANMSYLLYLKKGI